MPGERLDYENERRRHEAFVGRAALLARLDQWLIADDTDRWVVVTGGPGMGKSAVLAAWLAQREAAGARVPHHFIRRGEYDWDVPAKLVGSLVAQLEDAFPCVREPDGEARMHPATRLNRALTRVSRDELAPRRERLVVLIDGLDEYDPPAGAARGNPLAAFLPHVLPAGVRVLCASRPRYPYLASLAARHGELVSIDLDAPDSAPDNDATVRAYWEREADPLGLDAGFVDAAVARAGGNLQHAVQLRKHLAVLPAKQRRVEDIPHGLAALHERSWERIASDAVVVDGLGILCAAREALTLDELAAVAGWTGEAQRRFLHGAKELLVETRRRNGHTTRAADNAWDLPRSNVDGARRAGDPDPAQRGPLEYRLHHDSIRGHIAQSIGEHTLRTHHGALAKRLATWPAPVDVTARRYALRNALIHRVEAGDLADAWRVAGDTSFLETKIRELGVDDTEADIAWVTERCRATGNDGHGRRFDDLARALARDSHWLRDAPEASAALVWNRLRRSGWSASDLDALRVPSERASFFRVRHAATRESPALVRDLVGHSGMVLACTITPNGRRAVSGSDDRTLKVWDLESGRALATLEGHSGGVTACAVTPDGRRVVSASNDYTLKVWDLESGRPIATLKGHIDRVNACAVTPDGRRVVSASFDRTLKVWDLESGRPIATLEGHTRGVATCVVTPDSRRAISASGDGTLKVWDLERGRSVASLKGHTNGVRACAVTFDGRRVVSASEDRTLRVWNLESGRPIATLEGHTDWVTACAVTPDGRSVVSASEDRTLRIWDLESGRPIAALEGHTRRVNACAVTPDGRSVVSASWDRTLKVWGLENGRRLATLEGHTAGLTACVMTPDGRSVVSASEDRTLKVWDLKNGRPIATLEGHARWVNACAVTPDGRRLVSASDDATLKVWDLGSRRPIATLEGHTEGVNACAVTPDGRHVISGSWDATLKVWDLESMRLITTLEGHGGWVIACAVTPDGRYVISASEDRTLKVWDLMTMRPIATLVGHTGWVTACAVIPDGQRVVSASSDGTLKIWDIVSGRPIATLQGHNDEVKVCVITPDGQRVISGSKDRTLKVWDIETRRCVLTHRGDAPFTTVAATTTSVVAGDNVGGLWFLDKLPTHERSFPRPPKDKHTILFLAANPIGTDRLALDQEAQAIEAELESTGHRHHFDFVTRWAAEPLDLLRELRKLKPTVVHFSGQGGARIADAPTPNRDFVEPGSSGGGARRGLYFQNRDGEAQWVSAEALAQTFGAAGASVQLIVLNACYSDQATALLSHVPCVVGIVGTIDDHAARTFAIGFYGGLGDGASVAEAYDHGRAAISLMGLCDTDLPQLQTRTGVDASQLVLAAKRASTVAASPTGPSASAATVSSAAESLARRAIAAVHASASPEPPHVDIGILTVRPDEFRAVLDTFPARAGVFKSGSREYTLRHADAGRGQRYTIAVLRQVEQGNGEAQDAARDLLHDLAPRLILVVGIAGGLPSDVTLGDVVLATRIHDLTVETREYGDEITYAATGGAIDRPLAAAVANLDGRDELGDWTASLPPRPIVAWADDGQVYGPPEWQHKLRAKLEHHHGATSTPRTPVYMAGPIASSDRLIKDPRVLFPWITTARNILAVEMESGGVYRAARGRCPMLAVRGISDIVGLQREEAWTKFACASAAAFTAAFLRTRPVPVGTSPAAANPS